MSQLAAIEDERHGGTVIARIIGEIDASNTDWIDARVRALLTNHNDALAIDLRRTVYLDSAGIALLFSLGAELRLRQQALHLVVDPRSSIARMVSLTGLDTTLPTHHDLEFLTVR